YVEQGRSPVSLEQTNVAIRLLRDELNSSHGIVSATTMCASLLVCNLQLFEGSPWTGYLELMINLYRLEDDLAYLQPDPEYDLALRHQLEVLAMMDISFLVLSRASASVGMCSRFCKLKESWAGGWLAGLKPVLGLPQSLVDILARTSEGTESCLEQDLWYWPGEVGHLLQYQHWDAARCAAILRLLRCHPCLPTDSTIPSSELLLYRLLNCLRVLQNAVGRPEYDAVLSMRAAIMAISEASLMVTLLRKHKEWAQSLHRIRQHLLGSGSGPTRITELLFELLDEAWDTGQDEFDLDARARARGIEIAIF
ncbi:uncharacterized protein B0I36DRAFT_411952, partial [Microdochium trichocladiopsis]